MSGGSVSEAAGRFPECEANRLPDGGMDRDAVGGKRRDSTIQTPRGPPCCDWRITGGAGSQRRRTRSREVRCSARFRRLALSEVVRELQHFPASHYGSSPSHSGENPLDPFLGSASKQSASVEKRGARSPSLDHSSLGKLLLPALTAALFSGEARCQSAAFGPASPLADAPAPVTAMPTFDVSVFRPGTFGRSQHHAGFGSASWNC
jgi:hypothetical protein